MYNVKNILEILEKKAPLKLSALQIENGAYDNSGIIADLGNKVENILFSLDLTEKAIEKAISLNVNLIVTHHPAIYLPIKSIDVNGENKALALALKNGISVISMHLNLDVASGGIDESLALALGAKKPKILQPVTKNEGYGREFLIEEVDINEYADKITKALSTDKVVFYGQGKVKKVASFCGAGASTVLELMQKGQVQADTIVTSDMAHHQLVAISLENKKIILIPHYVAENYGFKKFYEWAKADLDGKIQSYYFEDRTFM